MRSLLARFAVLGAFAVTMTACGGGNGTSLPFAGPPNSAGGSGGLLQSGSNGTALVRIVDGSPDAAAANIDICIDQTAFNINQPTVGYGKASFALYGIAGGISHTVAVYTSLPAAQVPGSECPTAPGPYFGSSALAVTTITPGVSTRMTVLLGGTAAAKTFGLYVFNEPTFPIAPTTAEVISHNAAPTFSTGKTNGVGFGTCSTTVAPCAVAVALPGAAGVPVAKVSAAVAAVTNSTVTSSLGTIPAGFYDGIGVAAGSPVPVTSVASPSAAGGQPYVAGALRD